LYSRCEVILNGEKKAFNPKELAMTAKRHVLIPIDGSEFSLQILNVVKDLLPAQENLLMLLRVEPEPHGMVAHPVHLAMSTPYTSMYTSHQDAIRARHPIYASQEIESQLAVAHSAMLSTVRHLEEYGYQVELMVRFGDPVEEIVNYLDNHQVDLIAMTTHGRTGIQKLLFGSVAAELVRQANVPILLLRPAS
jgi:nucleotide-binding universal stress UspA family protein